MENRVDETERQLKKSILKILKEEENIIIDDADDLIIGNWNCYRSPIGLCLYNDDEYPCHDSCLYCFQPS